MNDSPRHHEQKDKPDAARRLTMAIVLFVVAGLFAGMRILPLLNPKSDTADSVTPDATFGPIAAMTQPEATSQPGTRNSTPINRLKVKPVVDNPAQDGWDTEVFSQLASTQLKTLVKLLAQPRLIDSQHIAPLIIDDVQCDPLRPAVLLEAYHDAGLTVERGSLNDMTRQQGSQGMIASLRSLVEEFKGAQDVRGSIKLFNIDKIDGGADTKQYFSFYGKFSDHSLEVNATWTSRWRQEKPGDPPRLADIRVIEYEQVKQVGPPVTLFNDVTESALHANESFTRILMQSVNHWAQRIESPIDIEAHALNGLAVGDVNGDGLDDLYFANTGGIPNCLLIQNPDGTVTDRSRESGTDWMESCVDALLLDLDNDGDQDLIITMSTIIMVMANDGTGKFEIKAQLNTRQFMCTLSGVDYDSDGDLDIYVTINMPASNPNDIQIPYPYYDATNGGRNIMYRNDGQWQFSDTTDSIGLDVQNTRYSHAGSWDDYDNDGDMDLYVANDFGRNCLYRNDDGQFTDVTIEADVEDIATGMGVTWGDYNRDGWMDLYISNMFSSAGSRITDKDQFKTGLDDKARAFYKRLAQGNTLFKNLGNGKFSEVSDAAGVTMGRWSWSSLFADLNNDGLEDLVIGNGFITNEISDDL